MNTRKYDYLFFGPINIMGRKRIVQTKKFRESMFITVNGQDYSNS